MLDFPFFFVINQLCAFFLGVWITGYFIVHRQLKIVVKDQFSQKLMPSGEGKEMDLYLIYPSTKALSALNHFAIKAMIPCQVTTLSKV